MPLPDSDLFRVSYDWNNGCWTLRVAGSMQKSYPHERNAEGAKADLMKRLAEAPNGDTRAVIRQWLNEIP